MIVRHKIDDEDHPRNGQVGYLLNREVYGTLSLYVMKFDDGEVERFYAYQLGSPDEPR
jgi:hypothetical protein